MGFFYAMWSANIYTEEKKKKMQGHKQRPQVASGIVRIANLNLSHPPNLGPLHGGFDGWQAMARDYYKAEVTTSSAVERKSPWCSEVHERIAACPKQLGTSSRFLVNMSTSELHQLRHRVLVLWLPLMEKYVISG